MAFVLLQLLNFASVTTSGLIRLGLFTNSESPIVVLRRAHALLFFSFVAAAHPPRAAVQWNQNSTEATCPFSPNVTLEVQPWGGSDASLGAEMSLHIILLIKPSAIGIQVQQ